MVCFVIFCLLERSVALAMTSFRVLVPMKSVMTFHLSGMPPAYFTVALCRRASSSWVQSDDFLVSSSFFCASFLAAIYSAVAALDLPVIIFSNS